jgi:hypothetical protein
MKILVQDSQGGGILGHSLSIQFEAKLSISYTAWCVTDITVRATSNFTLPRQNPAFDYFIEYYRPRVFTTFERLFAYNLNPIPR